VSAWTEGTVRVSDRDAEVSRGHSRFVVGKAREALQCRKAEQQIGRAGNGAEGPNGPREGLNGVAIRTRDS
jgi:hypothetical protein